MYFEKQDASIYYEVTGEGEPLLLIHGIIVDSELYKKSAQYLSRYYKVITFDRRGNSRSIQKGGRTFSIDEQVQDVHDLLEYLQIGSAYIFGASAGAVIGMELLIRYPDMVRHLIMYEPAVLGEMQEIPEVREWVDKMTGLIEKGRYNSAIYNFALHINSFDTRAPKRDAEISARETNNHIYALTQEFPKLIAYHPDRAKFESMADRITVAAGERSDGTVYYRAAVKIAEDLHKAPLFYPGYHNLPYDLPFEFAVNVAGTLLFPESL